MAQPTVLNEGIGKPLKSAGFKKRKADTWYLDNPETIVVLNAQRSAYGKQYYINICVWLKELGNADAPPEHKCHIRCRWESLIPEDERWLEQLLNLEDMSLSDDSRIVTIAKMIHEHLVPFFSAVGSFADLRTLYHSDLWPKRALVHVAAQELLNRAVRSRAQEPDLP